jgi:CHAT domain-containing protein
MPASSPLTAPDVADIDGDGLLTVDEILGLKLNADWVVLSACNTAAGAGAGAEAVSGLGRAFFYAGSRALLVTNWSVHSESARDLVTDVFRRQADNPKLGRAEALRQAMMALLDGAEMKDQAGRTLYTYAHPSFGRRIRSWATADRYRFRLSWHDSPSTKTTRFVDWCHFCGRFQPKQSMGATRCQQRAAGSTK